MPPSRFNQVSRYRNAILTQSKPEERYTELGLSPLPDSGKLLTITSSSHILARTSSSSNSLIVLPHTATRKYGKQPPILNNVCIGQMGDFDVSPFQDEPDRVLIAAGSLQGTIILKHMQLPLDVDAKDQSAPITLLERNSAAENFSIPSSKAASLLSFHPTISSIFSVASHNEGIIYIWDINSSASPCIQLEGGSIAQWNSQWSPDGSQIAASGRDSLIRIWDPRRNDSCIKFTAHASKVKPSRVTFISRTQSRLILTTGFNQLRQREVAIWDQRNHSKPLKRISMDLATSPLDPVTDFDRGIVYMTAKEEFSIRWMDIGSEDQGGNFAEGAHTLNFPATSAALGPSDHLELKVGEIGKLYVATSASSTGGASASDCIIPVSIKIPRRTYIDFHSDLYPLTPDRSKLPRIASEKWLKGEDIQVPLISLDPKAKRLKELINDVNEKADYISSSSPSNEDTTLEAEKTTSATVEPISNLKKSTSSAVPAAPSIKAVMTNGNKADPTSVRQVKSSQIILKPASFPHWSRRFLTGVTPLVPSFQNLDSVDLSRAPAAKMIVASTDFFFFPLSGPGGRLGVYPLNKEGRLPLHIPSLQHGAALGDFIADPFHQDQVITSAADGLIRLWKISPLPQDGEEWPSNLMDKAIKFVELPSNPGSNKIAEICPHPFVEGLVATVPADTDGRIHLVDLETEIILKSVTVPTQGLYSAVWSPDGSVLAAAGKDRQLYILDVRTKGLEAKVLGKASAHDSSRPFNIVWLDNYTIITVGHTTGSLRQLKLYDLDYKSAKSLNEIAKQNLDVSPSIIFPYWDRDVNILWLWSKGERLISSFEVQSENEKEPFLALPAFQHKHPQLGLAFLRKDCVNVRDVEIDCSIRLCKDELQRVSWKIARSRPEFFQDDIYQPTIIVEKPLLEANEWMSGKDASIPPLYSLQPEKMIPLSQAPAVTRTSTLPKGPISREKTDKEREEEVLSNIFEKAKGNDEGKDPNHNEEQAARAPDEDDWGSD